MTIQNKEFDIKKNNRTESITHPSTIRNNYKVLREIKDARYILLWTYRHFIDYQNVKSKSVALNFL